jgi:NTE family protein
MKIETKTQIMAPGAPPAFRDCFPGAAGRRRLGAYQAGVYEALAEAGIYPNWIAGISIGGINAATAITRLVQSPSRHAAGTIPVS